MIEWPFFRRSIPRSAAGPRLPRSHASFIPPIPKIRAMHWIYDLPLWVMCLMFMLGSVALGVGGVLLARRSGWTVSPDDNGTAASLHAFVGVVYAVALGLMVVAVQGEYGEVEAAAREEASAAGDLYGALEGMTPATRAALRAEVSGYLRMVVEEEWPAVQHGRTSEDTWHAVDRLSRRIHTLEPASPAEERLFPELTEEMDKMLDARRRRLFLGQSGIGAATWIVILLGGTITLGFACFFHMERLRSQLFLTGLTAAMFGLMLFLIVAMDHPLWGRLSVQPDAFHEIRASIARLDAETRAANVASAGRPD